MIITNTNNFLCNSSPSSTGALDTKNIYCKGRMGHSTSPRNEGKIKSFIKLLLNFWKTHKLKFFKLGKKNRCSSEAAEHTKQKECNTILKEDPKIPLDTNSNSQMQIERPVINSTKVTELFKKIHIIEKYDQLDKSLYQKISTSYSEQAYLLNKNFDIKGLDEAITECTSIINTLENISKIKIIIDEAVKELPKVKKPLNILYLHLREIGNDTINQIVSKTASKNNALSQVAEAIQRVIKYVEWKNTHPNWMKIGNRMKIGNPHSKYFHALDASVNSIVIDNYNPEKHQEKVRELLAELSQKFKSKKRS